MDSETLHQQQQQSEALTTLDERLEEALRAAGVGAFELDLGDGSLRLSAVIDSLYGIQPGEGPRSVEQFFSERCHPEDRPRLEAALDQLIDRDVPIDLRFRVLTRDGAERELAAHARVVRDDSGAAQRLVGVVHDADSAGERRFRGLADSAPVLMWATDASLACTFFNSAYLKFTGRSLEQELGEGWRDLVHPDDQELVRQADARAEGGRAPFEARYRLRRHDGVYRWVQDTGMPVFGADGSFEGLVGGMVDLHDLVESEVMLDGIFTGSPLGLALFDPERRYLRVNDTYAALNGLPAEEHVGRTLDELVPDAAPLAGEVFSRVLRSGVAQHGIVVSGRRADGVERRLIASCIPLVIPGGQRVGLAAAVLDDTERHSVDERRAELLQRLALLVDASAVLDESLDADRLMSELAQLLVERFADECEAVLAGTGEPRRVAARSAPARAEPAASASPEAADGAALDPAGPGHVVIAPITARGRELGFLRLTRDVTAQPFSDEEFSLCAEIGRRAGLALDNAQLVREARAAERSADESRELLEALLEHAPVGFAYFDRDLRFVAVNRALAEINGVPAEEHVGRRVPDVVPDMDASVERDLQQVLTTGRALLDVEIAGATPRHPGRRRHFQASYYRVRIPGGDDALGLGATIVEVTRRRIAEDELRAQRDLYETLLRAQSEAGEAFVLFYGAHITYANDAAERLTGRTVDELRTLDSYLDLVPAPRRAEVVEELAELADGRVHVVSFQTEVERPDGSIAAVEVAARALRSGRGVQLVVLGRDVTERREQERERERLLIAERTARREIEAAHARAGLLAQVSAITERSLRLRSALGEVAELIVREVADVVAIDVIPRRGDQLERLAVGALEGDTRRELQRTLGQVKSFSTREATVEVARSGRQLWALGADAAATAAALGVQAPDERPRLAASGLIPLIARGAVVGVLGLGWSRERSGPGAPEHDLIDDLARRIALWIDNVQLYDERAQVASTLQTALLPPQLPAVPGLELAARYLAADEASEVGGDFYDVFRAGDGWAIAVGDVCGKGAQAAATTALARYTLRAAFLDRTQSPAGSFDLLERAMEDEDEGEAAGGRFLTAVLGVLSARAGGSFELTLASAGHPAPILLRADGRRETLEADGGVVGVQLAGGWEERVLALEPGDALVLYTDGVSEAARRAPLEADELAALLPPLAARDAEAIAESVVDIARTRGEGRLRDDVAVIAVRVPPTG